MAGAGRGFIENVTKNQQRALNIQLGQKLFFKDYSSTPLKNQSLFKLESMGLYKVGNYWFSPTTH